MFHIVLLCLFTTFAELSKRIKKRLTIYFNTYIKWEENITNKGKENEKEKKSDFYVLKNRVYLHI
jgi:hypothetical protein